MAVTAWIGGQSTGFVPPIPPSPLLPTATLLSAFDTLADWSNASSTVGSVDPTGGPDGASALQYDSGPSLAVLTITKLINGFDMPKLGKFAFFVKLDDDYDWQNVSSVTFSVQLNNTGSVYSLATRTGLAHITNGGLWISGSYDDLETNSPVRAAGVGNHRFRLAITVADPKVNAIKFSRLYYNIQNVKASVIFACDDAKRSVITDGVPIMRAANMPLTHLLPTDLVGQDGTRGTWQMYADAAAAGDSIQANITGNDQAVTDFSTTLAGAMAEVNRVSDVIVARGFRRPIAVAMSFGNARRNGTIVSSLSVSSSSTTITGIATTAGITAGMKVVLYGARGTRVASVGSGTVELTGPVTTAATNSPVDFVDDSAVFHGNKIQKALIQNGYVFAFAGTASGQISFHQFGLASQRDRMIYCPRVETDTTLVALQANITRAINCAGLVVLQVHDWNQICTDIVAWLKPLRDAGLCEVVTPEKIVQVYGNRTFPA